MTEYYRPIPVFDVARPREAFPLAGGWTCFDRVELLRRGALPRIVPASELPGEVLKRLSEPRGALSGLGFDAGLAPLVAERGVPLCIMHSVATPATMQDDPTYEDVLLDVYDFLSERVEIAVSAGIPRQRILVDPGIGFGKTLAHNLALLARISLFHGLGCPILLGVSRKRMIGSIGRAAVARDRVPGSVAAALAAVAQGTQILRVHDVAETAQAIRLFMAVNSGIVPEEKK